MEQKTEQKHSHAHLKAILKSPPIHTPAVPVPDWTSPHFALANVSLKYISNCYLIHVILCFRLLKIHQC